jgi:hypothetical protein
MKVDFTVLIVIWHSVAGRNLHVCGFTGSTENEEANSNCAPLCEGNSGETLPYSERA